MTDKKVALVTGASRGIGAVIARQLAAEGFAVAVNHRNSADLAQKIVAAIQADGGTAQAFAADITDETSVGSLVSDVENELGPVYAVIANATGPQPSAGVEDLEWSAVVEQLQYFVKSPLLLLRAALPRMKERGSGRFVQISSDVVELIPEAGSAYTAAKAAQRSTTKSWAKELGPLGITVNSVSPGWVPVERHEHIPDEAREGYAATVPMRRLGTPEDVAAAVSYLCSDAASFVNGVNITVNGGKAFTP